MPIDRDQVSELLAQEISNLKRVPPSAEGWNEYCAVINALTDVRNHVLKVGTLAFDKVRAPGRIDSHDHTEGECIPCTNEGFLRGLHAGYCAADMEINYQRDRYEKQTRGEEDDTSLGDKN